MQLILVKIKWHVKWKYLIQKFHDICLSYYFKQIWQYKNIHTLKIKSSSIKRFILRGVRVSLSVVKCVL